MKKLVLILYFLPHFLFAQNTELSWWNGLELQWKKTFLAVLEQKDSLYVPNTEQIRELLNMDTLAIIGAPSQFNKAIEFMLKKDGIKQMTQLNFELSNISGLKELRKLKVIICADHQISDLSPIANHLSIRRLSVAENEISSLKDLQKLDSIEILNYSGNQVSDFSEILHLRSLRKLNCAGNGIESLEYLQNFELLESLYCGKNELTSLKGIENLYKLKTLSCSQNMIKSLPELQNLCALEELNIGQNQLESLAEIGHLDRLQKLFCHQNFLSDLRGIEGLVKLTHLYCLPSHRVIKRSEIRRIEYILLLDCFSVFD
ncbi:MAG: leucine-rich repeat domain-containing protein [Bacteroidetes bacterium]|nr:MAG: leucine-rich repeat domain-containing protein [Bacteroidota bacterium]